MEESRFEMSTERNSPAGTLVKEREQPVTVQERRNAVNRVQAARLRWTSEHLIDAFENIVANITGEAEREDAVEVLLGLIRKEADQLEAAMRFELEEATGSGDRIDLLLDQAAHHQASAGVWLSRLP